MAGTLITDVTLVTADAMRLGGLRTDGERIAEILPAGLSEADLEAMAARHRCERVDGRGRWLIPGGVDPHVHFALRTGDLVTRDDFTTGSRAALAGGTTTVLDFVTPARGESLREAAEARLAEASQACCDVSLHQSVTDWREDSETELRICAEHLGLRSVKLYLAYLETIGLAEAGLRGAMHASAAGDLTVLMHCEDGAEVTWRQRELLAADQQGPPAHPRSRPPEVEEQAVRQALGLAAATGCRPYIVHVSTAGALTAIDEARARGETVLAETCPQYLLLDESLYEGSFAAAAPYVMSPPLRSREHREALMEALVGGTVDVVATDHCSFDRVQKARGRDNFTRIPGGAAGVQHRLALLFTVGVVSGELTPTDWVRLVAQRPAEIFGLAPRKGGLEPGADADLVLWDPDAEWVIDATTDQHRCDHSIYEGFSVRGRAERVWSRGECVVSDGVVTAATGRGRFLGR